MKNYERNYSTEAQGFSHNDPYDTRTYYTGQGHGTRDHMASGRGGYESGGLETRWDHYNANHYGRNAGTARKEAREAGNQGNYENDDYRYTSGNREWHLNRDNAESRNYPRHDRYNSPGRYATNRQEGTGRDMFEWVGSGMSNAWNRVTGGANRGHHRDRDDDWHSDRDNRDRRDNRHDYDPDRERMHRNRREQEPDRLYSPSAGPFEQNIERYGNKPLRGYEKGHRFGDDTPQSQQRIGDRGDDTDYRNESDFHRAGRNFDRYRNI